MIKLSREASVTRCFQAKDQEVFRPKTKSAAKGGVQAPFSAKAGALRRPYPGPDGAWLPAAQTALERALLDIS
jgi:hypothetical protein